MSSCIRLALGHTRHPLLSRSVLRHHLGSVLHTLSQARSTGIHRCPRGLSPVAHSGQCQKRPFTAVLSSCSHVIFLRNKFPASESAEVSAKTKREILARGRKGVQPKATEVLPHPQVWQGSWNCQLAFKKVRHHIKICLLFMYLFICV